MTTNESNQQPRDIPPPPIPRGMVQEIDAPRAPILLRGDLPWILLSTFEEGDPVLRIHIKDMASVIERLSTQMAMLMEGGYFQLNKQKVAAQIEGWNELRP